MKVKIVDKFGYIQDDNGIEVSEEDLDNIGFTKCFDVENNRVIDFDNSYILKNIEYGNKINELTMQLQKTDYIANKLAEAVSKYISTGDNTDVLLLREKYALELVNRETWRKEIDSLQEKLKNL